MCAPHQMRGKKARSWKATINDPLSTPTEALSSLLDTFSSPISDNGGGFPIGQLTGSPYKQMATSNRSSLSFAPPHHPPMYGSSMTPVNMSPLTGVVPLSNAPPPKNPKLYKTELCRSWMDHGRCNYGERCQYAHGEQEKRPIPRHPKYKTEACQSYHQSGYCPYGPRCHFIHSVYRRYRAMEALESRRRVVAVRRIAALNHQMAAFRRDSIWTMEV
ncbi:unnamed protein product [Nippostrongylus brasiliensis]|uniref:Protein TIS11 (inferred by orthology to a D. melanogaster protein) n=1 Tax=Nippostrongylus brasiliensis TaxID=27835 RepID=A0A158R2I8_NIPBR|nr:unnamed protein product [Nippostrongylus brasiliensis]